MVAMLSKSSPKGANYLSPGQPAWVRKPLPAGLQALKGRSSTLGARRGQRVVLITPLQGFAN